MNWTKADIGCYWKGPYGFHIGTRTAQYHRLAKDSGYELYGDGFEELGVYATLEEAQEAAETRWDPMRVKEGEPMTKAEKLTKLLKLIEDAEISIQKTRELISTDLDEAGHELARVLDAIEDAIGEIDRLMAPEGTKKEESSRY